MKFITFEGGEGSGKSTQSKKLADALAKTGYDVILTREPGGTNNSEVIRDLLVNNKFDNLHGMTELLLINAARFEHINKVILPSLKDGKIVICDRFVDSTIAYQGFGRKLGKKIPALIHNTIMPSVTPMLTFILDIEPKIGLSRVKDKNKYEDLPLDFHNRVRKAFIEIAHLASKRCHLIDAELNIDNISEQILNKVTKALDLNDEL